MPEPQLTRTVTVTNFDGLHIRAAMAIANTARRFDCRVAIVKNTKRSDGTDVLQIMSMAAQQGEQLLLEASGPQAEEALAALESLFANQFNGGGVS